MQQQKLNAFLTNEPNRSECVIAQIMKMGRSCYKCYQENPGVTTRTDHPTFSNRPKFQSNLKPQSISGDAVTPHKGFAMRNVKSAQYEMLYDMQVRK